VLVRVVAAASKSPPEVFEYGRGREPGKQNARVTKMVLHKGQVFACLLVVEFLLLTYRPQKRLKDA
jgi:hypothetical protein